MAKEKEDKKDAGEHKPKGEKKPGGGDKADKARQKRPQATAKVEIDEGTEPQGPIPTPRLVEKYKGDVTTGLKAKFGYKNALEVPRLDKIVISMGVAKYATAGGEGKAKIEQAERELTVIAGQKPVRC